MEIKFTIEPDFEADEYRELYTADVIMEDGTSFTVRSSTDDIAYAEFRADIFEDLFLSLAEATGINVEIEEDDYAADDTFDPEDALSAARPIGTALVLAYNSNTSDEDFNDADADRTGC